MPRSLSTPTGAVRVKAGVQFTRIAPAGFRILAALEHAARGLALPLTITCACDGHPASDPHTQGNAYDVRSHGFTAAQKRTVLAEVLLNLSAGEDDAPIVTGVGLATRGFFGQLEASDTENEHFHFQKRRGTTYP
jgi:hypothetical protein